MGTSLTLFRLKGIDVRVHWSFLLILVYGAFLYSGGPAGMLIGSIYGVITILLLFVCVTLHEFGHAFVAQYYGVHVKSIMLLPIGGVANLERVPEKPSQEFFIGIAGPLVNFVLAALLFPVVLFLAGMQIRNGDVSGVRELLANVQTPGVVNLLVYLLIMNLMLALFNLLPAFPMDGGRILRSLLAMTMDYVQATRVAVTVGRFMAVLLALWGIFLWSAGGGGIFLLLIAFFVYVGGGAEREAVESRAVLRNYTASQALTPGAKSYFVTDQLGTAADYLMVSYQTDFPVIDLGGKFAGVLSRPALIRALQTAGPEGRVVDAMIPAADVPVCKPSTDLATLWEKLATTGQRVAAVKDAERFLGLITLDDITEVVSVMGAANQGAQRMPESEPQTRPDGQSADA